jgi:hypothetical protein
MGRDPIPSFHLEPASLCAAFAKECLWRDHRHMGNGRNASITPDLFSAQQAAFIAEQAAQCGYCSNGMIMTSAALLAREAKPDAARIKDALAANLCRCGTHDRIVKAVLRAAGRA